MSEFVGDIIFHEKNYEILQTDPLILWNFPRLENQQQVSYRVPGKVSEECKRLLIIFGIAAGFEDSESGIGRIKFDYKPLIAPIIAVAFLISFAILIRTYRKA